MANRRRRRRRRQRYAGYIVILILLALICAALGVIALKKPSQPPIDPAQLPPVSATEAPAAELPTEAPLPEVTPEPEMTPEDTAGFEIAAEPEPTVEPTPEPTPEPTENTGFVDLPGVVTFATESTEAPAPEAEQPSPPQPEEPEITPEPALRTFTLSAAGDCTLGGDVNGQSYKRFHDKIADKGYDWCFKNVAPIFEADDVTLVNLEVALTNEKTGRKSSSGVEFWMRGKPENVKILQNCGIDVCNLSNNHTIDFLDKGLQDTKDNLDTIGMPYCDYDEFCVLDVNGVSVGFLGFSEWYIEVDEMTDIIRQHRPECEVLIVTLHAGSELKYEATASQQKYAHAIIDAGGDLVVGHHSHVVGGIEKYNGKYIVYSLGNFCFGGKSNPKDHDTFIYQQTFTVNENGGIVSTSFEIVPCYISSADNTNNYQPTPVTNQKEIDRIVKKIKKLSKNSDQ